MSRLQNSHHDEQTYAPKDSLGSAPLANEPTYHDACWYADGRETSKARVALEQLLSRFTDNRSRSLLESDLGVIAALEGDVGEARQRFEAALRIHPDCLTARTILEFLDAVFAGPTPADSTPSVPPDESGSSHPVRVALLSLLFNWPSTGGGTVHTAETGKFLSRAGYDVRHIYASYLEWGLGSVTEPTGVPSVPLEFTSESWNPSSVKQTFREAVDAFQPDYVIITDSWNTKPLLAEAVQGYRYFLRLAALECLCPLNNVRLLFAPETGITACPRQQLATPDACRQCVATRGHHSGSLHQAERSLAGFELPDYAARLHRAFAEAEGILVVNPLIATMVAPFAQAVHVVPSGFDAERFPPPSFKSDGNDEQRLTRLFFAGLTQELMKGFPVLLDACRGLWQKRHDFELIVTSEPTGDSDPFLRFIGWQSQEALPEQLRQADLLVFPTIAEEALGRSAVEAMGAGIPVIASRIGGLPFTVTAGLTGLLFEPGNARELAARIETLLEDPALRRRMGTAGRQRFEREFTWETIIDRHYRRLLAPLRQPAQTATA